MRKKKFRKGRQIKSLSALAKFIVGNNYIFWHGRPVHASFICSMPYRCVKHLVEGGAFFKAVENVERVHEQVQVKETKNAAS